MTTTAVKDVGGGGCNNWEILVLHFLFCQRYQVHPDIDTNSVHYDTHVCSNKSLSSQKGIKYFNKAPASHLSQECCGFPLKGVYIFVKTCKGYEILKQKYGIFGASFTQSCYTVFRG